MQVWLGLALFSLLNNQKSTDKTTKQPSSNLLKVLKTFLQTFFHYCEVALPHISAIPLG